jgi:hypothetical protein
VLPDGSVRSACWIDRHNAAKQQRGLLGFGFPMWSAFRTPRVLQCGTYFDFLMGIISRQKKARLSFR